MVIGTQIYSFICSDNHQGLLSTGVVIGENLSNKYNLIKNEIQLSHYCFIINLSDFATWIFPCIIWSPLTEEITWDPL